jgi:hypothetical protein
VPNEPSADNAGGFRRVAFTEPANDKGKVNIKQENPALRLPAGRYGQFKEKGEDHGK